MSRLSIMVSSSLTGTSLKLPFSLDFNTMSSPLLTISKNFVWLALKSLVLITNIILAFIVSVAKIVFFCLVTNLDAFYCVCLCFCNVHYNFSGCVRVPVCGIGSFFVPCSDSPRPPCTSFAVPQGRVFAGCKAAERTARGNGTKCRFLLPYGVTADSQPFKNRLAND